MVLLIFHRGPTLAQSTNLVVEWQRSLGGSSYDTAQKLLQTSDGAYLLGGSSASPADGNKLSPNHGWYDFWIVRLNAQGQKVWERTYGGAGEDRLQTLHELPNGGFVFGGSSASGTGQSKTSPNRGFLDYWVVRVNENGEAVWDRSFGGSEADMLSEVRATTDGGFLLAGTSASGINGTKTAGTFGGNDMWLVRLDESGDQLWDKAFGGPANDFLTSLSEASDGSFLLGGYSASGPGGNKSAPNRGDHDFWIIKIDQNGNKLWEQSFGGTSADRLFAVAPVPGGFVLAGESLSSVSGNKSSTNFGLSDFWIVQVDTLGNKVWDRSFGGFSTERAWSVEQTVDGGFIVGGRSSSAVSGNKTAAPFGAADYWLIGLDDIGNKRWERPFGGSDHDELFSVHQTSDGGYVMAGESRSTNGNKTASSFGLDDIWVIKLSHGPYQLSLQVNADGRGVIDAVPAPTVDGKYTNGTLVTLTARANSGFRFNAWSGDVVDTNASVQITMDNDRLARAEFISLAPPIARCSPAAITNFVRFGQTASTLSIMVWNGGGSSLNYTLTSNVPWLTVTPPAGASLEQTNLHILNFASSNLAVGSHPGILAITAPGVPQQTCTVTLAVFPGATNIWQKGFGGRDDDAATTMIRTSDGGLLLGGSSISRAGGNKSSQNFGGNDFWIVRVSSAGLYVWDKSFGGRADDELTLAMQTADGGFLLAGTSYSPSDGNKTAVAFGGGDFWLVRVDAQGNLAWDRSFGGTNDEMLYTVAQLSDGGFLLGGQSSSAAGGNKTSARFGGSDYWIVRVDPLGNKLWDRSFGGAGLDELKAIRQLGDGGYLLGGESASPPTGSKTSPNYGSTDFWILRLTRNAEPLWDKSFGGADTEIFWALETTSDSGFVLAGDTMSGISGSKLTPQAGQGDWWILRLDGEGNVVWERTMGGQGYDTLAVLQQAQDGSFLVAGSSESAADGTKTSRNFGGLDFWLARLGAEGAPLWDATFGGTGYDSCSALALWPDGTCTVAGLSDSGASGNKTTANLGGYDFWILRLGADFVRLGPAERGARAFVVFGPTNFSYVSEFSSDFATWNPFQSNVIPTSPFEVRDLRSANAPSGFYRTRLTP